MEKLKPCRGPHFDLSILCHHKSKQSGVPVPLNSKELLNATDCLLACLNCSFSSLHEQNSSGSLPDTSFIFSSWLARFLSTAKLSINESTIINQSTMLSEIFDVRASLSQGCGSGSGSGSALIWVAGSGSAFWIRILIHESKMTPNKERVQRYHVLKYWMFSWGLKASPVACASFMEA